MLEGERINDIIYNQGPITLDTVWGRPWCSAGGTFNNSGWFAFRHQMTMNVLFFDGHVERMGPKDDINTKDRLSLEPASSIP